MRNTLTAEQIEATKELRARRNGIPSAEQLASLKRFAKANGRGWKAELNHLWMNGAYSYAVLGGADPAHLQQCRNSFGPGWLVRFRLEVA